MSESGAEKFNQLNGGVATSRKPNGNHHLGINGQSNIKRGGIGSNAKTSSSKGRTLKYLLLSFNSPF